MRLKIGGFPPHSRAALNWHPHFCWWPVRLAHRDVRWLETIERRFTWIGPMWGRPQSPVYRARPQVSA